jgi:hypothetical protein
MISATNVAAPAMRMPGITSSAVISRRAAHCVHTVTVPSASTSESRSASGAACGSEKSAARPGRANQADSPVSHNDTVTPLATAVDATVKAWLQRSASSLPAVTLTTRDRPAMITTLIRAWQGTPAVSRAVHRAMAGGRGPPG